MFGIHVTEEVSNQ